MHDGADGTGAHERAGKNRELRANDYDRDATDATDIGIEERASRLPMDPLPDKIHCLQFMGYAASVVEFALCFPILGAPVIIGTFVSERNGSADMVPFVAELVVGGIGMAVFVKRWDRYFKKEEILAFTDNGISSKIYGEIPYSSLTTYETVRTTLPRSAEPIEGGMLKIWTSDKKILRFFFLRTGKINGTELFYEAVADFEEKIRQYQADAASGPFAHEGARIVRRPDFFMAWYTFVVLSVLMALAVLVVMFASNGPPGGGGAIGILPFIWIAIYHARRNAIGKK